jgi:mannose-6-phosphate isomerase-like protein (cupin superfamily)
MKVMQETMNEKMNTPYRIDAYRWEGVGFCPLVSCRDWLVALMNWEPRFDAAFVGEIERHNHTDEVFVLTQGRGVLFIATDESIQLTSMEAGVIYNVTAGTWHSVIGTKETTWMIIESNDTSEENTDHRQLTDSEKGALQKLYPDWLK